jgi:uncharacterized repeat protein (TIGR03803 family)
VTTNGTLTKLNGTSANGLTLGNDGNFYGTTQEGGSSGHGTVFVVTTNGLLTTLYSFTGGSDGRNPTAALTLGNDGNFYGTTSAELLDGSQGYGTVFRLLLPPIVIVQPQSQTNNAGATVTFPINVAYLQPLSFQWQENGTNLVDSGNISGSATNALTITGISDSDAANYSVIISNINGSVTSSIVTLTVIDPPIITAQPTNVLALPGTNVAFGVSLTGSTPFFSYHWQFNGTNILNATNATYAIPLVVTNKAGNYSVVVTNAAGSAVSSNAALTVVVSPKSQTNYAGSTATLISSWPPPSSPSTPSRLGRSPPRSVPPTSRPASATVSP